MTLRYLFLIAPLLLFSCLSCTAQIENNQKTIIIPFEPSRLDTTASKAEFVIYKGVKAIKMHPNGGQINLKRLIFTNGTIEFDTQPIDADTRGFAPIGIYFRQQNAKESEYLYLRTKGTTASETTTIFSMHQL